MILFRNCGLSLISVTVKRTKNFFLRGEREFWWVNKNVLVKSYEGEKKQIFYGFVSFNLFIYQLPNLFPLINWIRNVKGWSILITSNESNSKKLENQIVISCQWRSVTKCHKETSQKFVLLKKVS